MHLGGCPERLPGLHPSFFPPLALPCPTRSDASASRPSGATRPSGWGGRRRAVRALRRDGQALRRRRVSQPFFAAALRSSAVRPCRLFRPPFVADAVVPGFPRPAPDLLPPPDSLLTVA
jgi:hypothetical protein